MRMLPFFKPKKGFMVAGGGLETSAGGGGGGGGSFDFSTTEFNTGQKWVDGKDIYGIVKTSDFTSCPIFDTLIEYTGVAHRPGYGYFTFNNGLGTALTCTIRPSDAKNGTVSVTKEDATVIDHIIYYYTKGGN